MPLLPPDLRQKLLNYETQLTQQSPLRRLLTPYRSSQLMVLAEVLTGDWCDTREAICQRLNRTYDRLHQASSRFDNKAERLVYRCGYFSQLLQQCHEHLNYTFVPGYVAQSHQIVDEPATTEDSIRSEVAPEAAELHPDIAQLLTSFRQHQAYNPSETSQANQPQ